MRNALIINAARSSIDVSMRCSFTFDSLLLIHMVVTRAAGNASTFMDDFKIVSANMFFFQSKERNYTFLFSFYFE